MYSQGWRTFTFEDTLSSSHITIDTVSNPGNIWQIGKPDKHSFDTAYAGTHVLVTDTLNPYPANDTSSFIVEYIGRSGFHYKQDIVIAGWYQVNSDSLNDHGKIEMSKDRCKTWIEIHFNDLWPGYLIPTFTGNTSGWTYFSINLGGMEYVQDLDWNDTIYYKFSFISDAKEDTLDGLMFDELHFGDFAEGIDNYGFQSFRSNVIPNPALDNVRLEFENEENDAIRLLVYNSEGKVIMNETFTSIAVNIKTLDWIPGVYHYRLLNRDKRLTSTGKIIKSN